MEIKRDVSFPTTLAEVKVKHVVKYLSLSEEEKKNDFELLMIFAGDLAKYIKHGDASTISKDLRELIARPVDFHQTFMWGGIKYGIVPSLSDMSFGEFLDIQAMEEEGKMWENGHRILTILFRPVTAQHGSEYTIKPYESINETLALEWYENLSADILIGAIAFFLGLRVDLLTNSPDSTNTTPQSKEH